MYNKKKCLNSQSQSKHWRSREENHMLKRKTFSVEPTDMLKSKIWVRIYTSVSSLSSFADLHNILELLM